MARPECEAGDEKEGVECLSRVFERMEVACCYGNHFSLRRTSLSINPRNHLIYPLQQTSTGASDGKGKAAHFFPPVFIANLSQEKVKGLKS